MRYVLTGGPCCGKTSLIDLFLSKGLNVATETARKVVEKRGDKPYSEMQLEIFRKQIEKEQVSERTFFDRSAIDGIAYSNIYLGYIPKEIQDFNFRNRYDKVFIPDLLPIFENDGLRVESGIEEATKIHSEIASVYKSFGYDPIPVPVIPIRERGEFILGKI